MANFEEFLNELKDGIAELAKKEAGEFVMQAKNDSQAFLDKMKDDLQTWFKQLTDGQLSKADFEYLVKGRKDVAEMAALTQIGLAKVRVERIMNGVIDLVIRTALKAI